MRGRTLLAVAALLVAACGDPAPIGTAEGPATTLFRNARLLEGAPFLASAVAAAPADALRGLEGLRLNRASWQVEDGLRFEEISFVGGGTVLVWWQDAPRGLDAVVEFRGDGIVEDVGGATLLVDERPGPGGGTAGLYRMTDGSVIVSVLAVDVRRWGSDRGRDLVRALFEALVSAAPD
jgi:hypothetical protein